MSYVNITSINSKLLLRFSKELHVYNIQDIKEQLKRIKLDHISEIEIDMQDIVSLDTAAAIMIKRLESYYICQDKRVNIYANNKYVLAMLELVKDVDTRFETANKIPYEYDPFLTKYGKMFYSYYLGLLSFFSFIGKVFVTKFYYLKDMRTIRFKEIAYNISESGIKAIPIIATISFLIGLVFAYQSAYQLKIYGANIFLVDMVGIALLRELSPLITAVVVAGRSASVYTAELGAMKITQELDAMKSMGFNPYRFLVVPRIIALVISMPILIFISDIMGLIGGMVVANIDLQITTTLFIERFLDAVALKHFVIGVIKGPFFAFLIATIGIYRGFLVKHDTQSIGKNTTKSVVEAIFAVIICDALFSIVFTNLGI